MIPEGYILQPRAIDQSDIMHESPVVRELWFYLLRKVNHKDNGKYRRGEGFFNLSEMAEDLHWWVGYRKMKYSKPQLTKSLRRLRERNMIETAKATRGLIVTVCKYDYYQDPKNYEGNSEGNTKETRRKREGRTKNKNDQEKEISNSLDFDFAPEEFKPIVEEWLSYRNEIKKPYKSQKSVEQFLKKLQGFSENNPQIATEIINQSIANGYQGIFPLKKSETDKSKSNQFVVKDW